MNYILMDNEKRFESLDYVEGQVDKIIYELKDCLTGRVQRPDFLYIKSEQHSVDCGQVLLMDRLLNSGIEVRCCNGEDIPPGEGVWVYDLDTAEWIKH